MSVSSTYFEQLAEFQLEVMKMFYDKEERTLRIYEEFDKRLKKLEQAPVVQSPVFSMPSAWPPSPWSHY